MANKTQKEIIIMNNKENIKTNLIVGALAGTLLAGAATWIFAPKSRSYLRQNIQERYQETVNRLMNALGKKRKKTSYHPAAWALSTVLGGAMISALLLIKQKRRNAFYKQMSNTYQNLSGKTLDYIDEGKERLRDLLSRINHKPRTRSRRARAALKK
jgi:gas vesicle protein